MYSTTVEGKARTGDVGQGCTAPTYDTSRLESALPLLICMVRACMRTVCRIVARHGAMDDQRVSPSRYLRDNRRVYSMLPKSPRIYACDYYKETLLLENGVAARKAKRRSRNVDEQQVRIFA